MSRIWQIAREVEQPKKHLANQIIQWARFERYGAIALLFLTVVVYVAAGALLLYDPFRVWLGWR